MLQIINGFILDIYSRIVANQDRHKQTIIREYARDNMQKFVEIAEDEIGAAELAEHLHAKHNLFELVEGLEAELIAEFESEADYYNQMNYNYRYN